MKKLNTFLLFVIFTFSLNTVIAHATSKTTAFQDERTIGNFKGVATGGPITIKITMGNKESVRLEGDQEAIADLITEVNDGILTIKPKTKWNDWSRTYNRANVTVYITAKRLTSLTMSGSGNMEVTNTINGAELATTLSGSGSIKAAAMISGSGAVTLAGRSDDANLTLSGSGTFRGKTFSVNKASIQISGSANVYITVASKIEAVISGSGNIYYSGNATVKKTIIGSGNVTKM
jgi:hypothetical protein